MFKKYTIGLLGCLLIACRPHLNADDINLSVAQVEKLIPKNTQQADLWARDIMDILQKLEIERSKQNICTVIAVIDQESNFVANPVVVGLGEKSLKEMNRRLEEKLGKASVPIFRHILETQPNVDHNFLNRIQKVKTERELDELYREIFAYFEKAYHVSIVTGTAKILGRDIAESLNPITTLGSMQVHIEYAKEHKRSMMSIEDLRRDLYSQYGGLYYGIHRLMLYPASYDKPLYRFADYNSGMYSSRNAAFQKMVAELSHHQIDLDGDLLMYTKEGHPKHEQSQSEKVIIQYLQQQNIEMTARQIRFDLKREKTQSFENTILYKKIAQLYTEKTGKPPRYAIMPEVVIKGPKLSQDYNTNWYATKVEKRYQSCMAKSI